MKPHKPQRTLTIVATLAASLLLSSCSGLVKDFKEMQADSTQSRAAQLMRIATSTRQGGDFQSALALFRRASGLAPQELPPLIAIGEVSYRLGLYDQAARAYERAIAIAPDDLTSHSGLGKTLIALDRPQQAVPHFETVIGLAADRYGGYNGLGVALDMLGRHGLAQGQYRKGLAVAPRTLSVLNNLALSLAIDGKFDEATALLSPFQDDPRAGAPLRQNMALIYGLAGQEKKAAAIASRDLAEGDVVNNLKFYKRLRAMTGNERAKALLGAVKR